MVNLSVGAVIWRQSEDDKRLEIETEILLPSGASPKDLTVEIKDLEVLCVKYKEAKILQWRLTLPVKSDKVEWNVENGGTLIIELEKTMDEAWPQLVGWPVSPTDNLMKSEVQLDTMLSAELPPLPPVKPSENSAGAEKKNSEGEVEDVDDLLDQALAEEENQNHPLVLQELEAFAEDAAEVRETKERLEELLEKTKEDPKSMDEEEFATLNKQLDVVTAIERINLKLRDIRSEPSTLANYFKFQDMDIQKARANTGDTAELETELFAGEDEKLMSGNELYQQGMKLVGEKETTVQGLHFLRLAALHKHDARACIMLFRLYEELNRVGTGSYFLLFRAQMDDCEPMTNSLCAELHDNGVALFAPLMALSVYYHQRAARTGASASMIKLANLFQRGCATGSFDILKDSKIRDVNRSMENFNAWLTAAEDRGSGSAYFAKMDLHLNGDLEYEKSYVKARSYFTRALASTPQLRRVAPNVEKKLAELKAEQAPKVPATLPSPSKSEGEAKNEAETKNQQVAAKPRPGPPVKSVGGGMMGGANKMGSKLGALEARSGNARANMDQSGPQGGDGGRAQANGAGNKRFWERTVTTGIACFSIYTLLFPLRVMLLPQFYMAIDALKGMVLGALMGGGGRRQQVSMGY